MTTPGALAADWAQGRRSAYLSPSGLYLVSAAMFVIITALFSDGPLAPDGSVIESRGPIVALAMGAVAGSIEERVSSSEMADDDASLPALQERAARWMSVAFRWVLLILMVPALALLTRTLLGQRGDYLATHLVFSLHLHSFLLLLSAASLLLFGLASLVIHPSIRVASAFVVPVGLGWYMLYGARRLFHRSRLSTVLRVSVVLTAYGFGLGIAVALIGVAAAWA